MNIQIIANQNSKNNKESALLNSLIQIFKDNKIKYTIGLETYVAVDCILLLNNGLMQEAKSCRDNLKKPLIYMLYKSDSLANYTLDTDDIDHIILINDIDIDITLPYTSLTSEIAVPLYIEEDNLFSGKNSIDILVSTEGHLFNDTVLLKITRCLNKMPQFKIEVNTNNQDLSEIMNSNVQVFDKMISLEEKIINSKIIIGSGYSIYYAIKHRKPFIVLGEKGYGGIVNRDNIMAHFLGFFQGSICGKFDGKIPVSLVYDDIINLIKDSSINTNIYEVLKELINKNNTNFINSINKIIHHNIFIEESYSEFKLNNDYIFEPIDSNNMNILNRYTQQVVAILDMHYAKIILEYKNSAKQLSLNDTKYIKELIINRILI